MLWRGVRRRENNRIIRGYFRGKEGFKTGRSDLSGGIAWMVYRVG
jgi:hypothetical protein